MRMPHIKYILLFAGSAAIFSGCYSGYLPVKDAFSRKEAATNKLALKDCTINFGISQARSKDSSVFYVGFSTNNVAAGKTVTLSHIHLGLTNYPGSSIIYSAGAQVSAMEQFYEDTIWHRQAFSAAGLQNNEAIIAKSRFLTIIRYSFYNITPGLYSRKMTLQVQMDVADDSGVQSIDKTIFFRHYHKLMLLH